MDPVTLIVLFVLLFVFVWIIASYIRIVPEYQRLVVLRLGRVVRIAGPGLVFLVPFIEQGITVDLREQYIEVTKQTCITRDNAPVDIDFLIYFKVIDPKRSVVEVSDFRGAAVGIATTTLRAVVGDIELDQVLAKREYINEVLREKLDEVTARWGVKVTAVEIREILPPREVQDAMIKQMSAERNRRAMVTEAEGKREAAIKVAQGEKEAMILKAEGEKQAAILRAEGAALALKYLDDQAKLIDEKTLMLQYFTTLKDIASSPSTKFVLPLELFKFLKPFEEMIEKRTTKE
ncbi:MULTISPECIES: SPFH domain-containing protein [Thermofilum]|jgi:regulator of protease activity HflC (stomatin/prohibitin superfamily)|uniref:SPFH domain, Band 7 family protein n=1 Tax=Thermofilum adornatum 1505 TaxID=697581 RepID=A0A3G1A4D7_9CREN|nr:MULTISPECIES: SPFH domain-containing protein [Thermofilum]AJB41279.1 SPFH domain, Band 7 family protein [Thermofilum adornatum 1505]NAZ24812.1 SPFH/Band 7/PHB domain protein [Thermofilum sp.]